MNVDSHPVGGSARSEAGLFPATHWSMVLAAGGTASPEADAALARLCQTYWRPVYAFIRRGQRSPEDAQDLTQEFFARLIERQFFSTAVEEKGRFRSFLLTALKRFLVNAWEHGQAQKRGGGRQIVSLDAAVAEEGPGVEPADEASADRVFEKRWAMALLDSVLAALRTEHAASQGCEWFDALKPFLYGEPAGQSQAEIGVRFGQSESAVKSAVHRMRRRYREILREQVTQTVAHPTEVEPELRHLLTVLSA